MLNACGFLCFYLSRSTSTPRSKSHENLALGPLGISFCSIPAQLPECLLLGLARHVSVLHVSLLHRPIGKFTLRQQSWLFFTVCFFYLFTLTLKLQNDTPLCNFLLPSGSSCLDVPLPVLCTERNIMTIRVIYSSCWRARSLNLCFCR